MFQNICSKIFFLPKEIFSSCINLIKNPRETPFEDISSILLSTIKLFAIIFAIVLFILFIADGSYVLQVKQIGGTVDIYDRWDRIVDDPGFFTRIGASFTTGRMSTYYSDFAVITYGILLAVPRRFKVTAIELVAS